MVAFFPAALSFGSPFNRITHLLKGISFAHKYFTHTEEYIRFYNEERIQIKLNKLTPVEYRRQLA
ncbi:MAG: hypothetical protein C6W57_12750 [Caldibacillus debilis]|nr:MAG: hypothetical protein C6W57_12750 [Caldibacillus debilis]